MFLKDLDAVNFMFQLKVHIKLRFFSGKVLAKIILQSRHFQSKSINVDVLKSFGSVTGLHVLVTVWSPREA